MSVSDRMWDQRYSVPEYIYGTEPNEFFKEQLANWKPGKLLLPGDGEGRNSVYAAGMGWDVFAFDASEQAMTKALILAASKKVTIHYAVADIETASYPAAQFDAICLIYVHLSGDVRTKYHRKLIEFLKPGGILLLEAYSKEQITRTSGGPKDVDMLYSEKDISDDFCEMKITELCKEVVLLNEGQLHQGEASLIRLIAIKK